MKKLLSLGGNFYQMSMVKEAKRMGIYVIDVDYLPDNPAHKYADEYYNISITEKDAVLDLARKLQIDGIISFASDVGARTAAYVAEQMGLATNSYHTIELMTRKDLFHPFLKENGFCVPDTLVIKNANEIIGFLEKYKKIIVKPSNSSGSKGISVVTDIKEIETAYKSAKEYSRGEAVIAEEFFEKAGYQISGDIFVVDGIVKNWGFANGHRDETCNALVPIGDSFPVCLDERHLRIVKKEIQRAINALKFLNGPVNVEFVFDQHDRPIIVELGPRSGGGLLADIIYLGSGVNIIEYCIKAALGENISAIEDIAIRRYLAAYSFHSNREGVFDSIVIDEKLRRRIRQIDYFVEKGDNVYKCNQGGCVLGIAICEFASEDEMLSMMDHMNEYYKVCLD